MLALELEAVIDFGGVLTWLVEFAAVEPGVRCEVIEHMGGAVQAAVLDRGRARVIVTQAGGYVPRDFGSLLVLGSGRDLTGALRRLPARRVFTHALPLAAVLLRRAVEQALEVAEAYGRARVADQLVDIGLALNLERDPRRVLELILSKAREITCADAGSIYTVKGAGGERRLRLSIAQNDSRHADYTEFTIPVSETSIVGASVLSGKIINLTDLYSDAGRTALGRTFTHDRSLDERFGYQTRSMLTVPMRTPGGEVIGAFQLINAKRDRLPLRAADDFDRRVTCFSDQDERLCSSLATQGAVALENASLYREIQALFRGFVRASVLAIEQRDPTTSGHSQRVADLTVAIARQLDRDDSPRFERVRFTVDQLREIEYAGLLHDFGKVGVREEVLVKAKKLHRAQLELVLARLEHMRTAARARMLEDQLARARARQPDDGAAQRAYAARLAEIEGFRQAILAANEPSIMPEEAGSAIHAVAAQSFHDVDGRPIRLLEGPDLQALLIERGSLTPHERTEVQNHVRHTYAFLRQIPWGRDLGGVPEIAAKHHEYLNGSGYPNQLPAAEIPVQARMMTIADIFDALTAADRPYKKAVPIPRALDILGYEARAGKIDADILEVFIAARVFDCLNLPGS